MASRKNRKKGQVPDERKGAIGSLSPTAQKGTDWYWLLLLLLPPILLFPMVGDGYLWQDEAETAMIGRAIIEHGYPLAQVGPNLITDQPHQNDLSDSGVWIWSPWLPGYLVALSLALLGKSTAAARLPFVLAGWAALFVQYATVCDITRNRRLARIATTLLLVSVPFILHVRQCRYYPLLVLFSILQVWGYLRLTRRQAYGMALFVAGGIGLFYSWYPQLAESALAMVLHALLFHRKDGLLRSLFLGFAWIGAACLPFFLYTRGWSRDYLGSGYNYEDLWRYLSALRAYLLQIHVYCWPGLIALPLLWKRISGREKTRRESVRNRVTFFALLGLVAVGSPASTWTFVLMAIALAGLMIEQASYLARESKRDSSPASLRKEYCFLIIYLTVGCLLLVGLSAYPFFRYFLGLLPLFSVLTALTLIGLAAWRKWLFWPLATCIVCCNLLQLGPFTAITGFAEKLATDSSTLYLNDFGYLPNNNAAALILRLQEPFPRIQSTAWQYLQEITHHYVGPIGGVVIYLNTNAHPEDKILTTYEQFPLMFYTDLKVYSSRASSDIPGFPDWVLIHGTQPVLSPFLAGAVENPNEYQMVSIPAFEFFSENIPEPAMHRFVTPANGAPVKLFRRVQRNH